jgi:hypothetical protein
LALAFQSTIDIFVSIPIRLNLLFTMDQMLELGEIALAQHQLNNIGAVLDNIFKLMESHSNTYNELAQVWRPKACDFIARVLDDPVLFPFHDMCWGIINTSLELGTRRSSNDFTFEEVDTMDFTITKLDLFQRIAQTCVMQHQNSQIGALFCLLPISLQPKYATAIANARIIHLILLQLKQQVPLDVTSQLRVVQFVALSNLSIHSELFDQFDQEGMVEVAREQLIHLQSRDLSALDCALSCSFILIRLNKLNELNSQVRLSVVRKLKWILNQVTLAGPDGIVLGARWNPANIVMDVCSLCKEEELCYREFLYFIVQAFKTFGRSNARLTKFSVAFLFQACCLDRLSLLEFRARIIPELKFCVWNDKCRLETFQMASFLVKDLQQERKLTWWEMAWEFISYWIKLFMARLFFNRNQRDGIFD